MCPRARLICEWSAVVRGTPDKKPPDLFFPSLRGVNARNKARVTLPGSIDDYEIDK